MKLLFTSSRSQVICMMKAIAVSRFSRLIWFLQDWLYLICTRHDFSHIVEEHFRRKLRLVIYWDENGLLIAGFAQGLLTMIQLTFFCVCIIKLHAIPNSLIFTKFVCFLLQVNDKDFSITLNAYFITKWSDQRLQVTYLKRNRTAAGASGSRVGLHGTPQVFRTTTTARYVPDYTQILQFLDEWKHVPLWQTLNLDQGLCNLIVFWDLPA